MNFMLLFADRHSERSEAQSKDPAALPLSLRNGIPRLGSE